MSALSFSNLIRKTVQQGYGSTATSIEVDSIAGLPAVPFRAVWYDRNAYPDPTDDPKQEIIEVTNAASVNLTVKRGDHADLANEGIASQTHNTGGGDYVLVPTLTAGFLNNIPRAGNSTDADVISENNIQIIRASSDPRLRFERTASSGIWNIEVNTNNDFILKEDTRTIVTLDAAVGSNSRLIIDEPDTSGSSILNLRTVSASNTAGDCQIRMTCQSGVTDWSSGIDNSDNDAYKICKHALLGSADRLRIDKTANQMELLSNTLLILNTAGAAAGVVQFGASGPQILTGTQDPTSTGTPANLGSLFIKQGTGLANELYQKTGTGSTDWTEFLR